MSLKFDLFPITDIPATRTHSPFHLVSGDDRRIHLGINLARDAIYASGKIKTGCGLLDTDYLADFYVLDMSWVFQVLRRKGLEGSTDVLLF